MKVYGIYALIPTEEFENRMSRLVYDKNRFKLSKRENYYYGLYAWTTKKKVVKEFLDIRNKNMYKVQEIKIPKEDEKDFKLDFKFEELAYYKYIAGKEEYEVLTTLNEFTESCDNRSENLSDLFYGKLTNEVADYMILKQDLIDALDIIGYTTYYDIECGGNPDVVTDEEAISRTDFAGYHVSFGQTVFGRNYVDFTENELAALLYIYGPMFVGVE